MAEQQDCLAARPQQQTKSAAQKVFEKNLAMATMVMKSSYLSMATNAYSADLITKDLMRGVTSKNLTTTPSERMVMLLWNIVDKLDAARDAETCKAIMKTFLDIVRAEAAYRPLVKQIGKQHACKVHKYVL